MKFGALLVIGADRQERRFEVDVPSLLVGRYTFKDAWRDPMLGGAGYSRHHQTMNRRMVAIIARFDTELGSTAEEHHFDWVSQAGVMGGSEPKERLYLADGVHTNEVAQRLIADAMLPLIAGRWGR